MKIHCSLLLGLLSFLSIIPNNLALEDEERAAALDLAIGPLSSTVLKFERVCAKTTSRQERLAEGEVINKELQQSFAEIVDSSLSPSEKKEHEAVRRKILSTIMEDFVKICSSNEGPNQRLDTLKRHAEMFSRPDSTFTRVTMFDNCKWMGTAPFCNGRCPNGWWFNVFDSSGDGKKCMTGRKAYCCQ